MEEINMIKKSTIIKLAASAGLMTSFALTTQYSNINVFTPQTVQASSKFRVKLTHNAYIYNYRGKRRGRKVLKKGRKYTAYRTKRIHHKKYYYLGHHNYIKAGNAKKFEEKKASKYLFSVKLNLGAEIDVKPAGQISQWDMYGTVKVYQVQKVNNQTWYKLGRDRWVKASETNKNPDITNNKIQSNVEYSKNTEKSTNSSLSSNKTVQKKEDSNEDNNFSKIVTSEFAKKVSNLFITKLNKLRRQNNLAPVTQDPELQNFSEQRASEILQNFSHNRPNGKDFNLYEVIDGDYASPYTSPDEMAESILHTFIFDDASANWAHKHTLLSPDVKTIGCSIAWESKEGVSWFNYSEKGLWGLRFVADLNS